MNLGYYVLRRTAASLLALAGVLGLVFFICHVLPGNPIIARATQATKGTIDRIEHQLGLNRPLVSQFASYVSGLAHGDLGTSANTGNPVSTDLGQDAPATIELALAAIILAVVVSVPLGVAAALRRGGLVDRFARLVSSLAVSLPAYFVGLLLIYFFYFRLGVAVAPVGRLDLTATPPPTVTGLYTVDALLHGQWSTFWNAASHLLLPAITLALLVSAPLIRVTRSSMIEALEQPYITCGRALGLSHRQVVFHDALKSSLLSILTVIGLAFGYLVSGTLLVEFVFSWPGVGLYAYNALQNNDIPAIEGFVLVVATVYIGINWLIDILYGVIDPRVRTA
jgi:peptide/nickel transport system permease protein